jgi:hypothetical protein
MAIVYLGLCLCLQKQRKILGILVFTVLVMYVQINSDQNGLGYILGEFFKNSSGHPDPGPVPCGPNYALIFSDINENSKCSHVVVFDDTIF